MALDIILGTIKTLRRERSALCGVKKFHVKSGIK